MNRTLLFLLPLVSCLGCQALQTEVTPAQLWQTRSSCDTCVDCDSCDFAAVSPGASPWVAAQVAATRRPAETILVPSVSSAPIGATNRYAATSSDYLDSSHQLAARRLKVAPQADFTKRVWTSQRVIDEQVTQAPELEEGSSSVVHASANEPIASPAVHASEVTGPESKVQTAKFVRRVFVSSEEQFGEPDVASEVTSDVVLSSNTVGIQPNSLEPAVNASVSLPLAEASLDLSQTLVDELAEESEASREEDSLEMLTREVVVASNIPRPIEEASNELETQASVILEADDLNLSIEH